MRNSRDFASDAIVFLTMRNYVLLAWWLYRREDGEDDRSRKVSKLDKHREMPKESSREGEKDATVSKTIVYAGSNRKSVRRELFAETRELTLEGKQERRHRSESTKEWVKNPSGVVDPKGQKTQKARERCSLWQCRRDYQTGIMVQRD